MVPEVPGYSSYPGFIISLYLPVNSLLNPYSIRYTFEGSKNLKMDWKIILAVITFLISAAGILYAGYLFIDCLQDMLPDNLE